MELKNKRRALSSIFVSLALLLSMVVTWTGADTKYTRNS